MEQNELIVKGLELLSDDVEKHNWLYKNPHKIKEDIKELITYILDEKETELVE